jgi:hypothetical protein
MKPLLDGSFLPARSIGTGVVVAQGAIKYAPALL